MFCPGDVFPSVQGEDELLSLDCNIVSRGDSSTNYDCNNYYFKVRE